MADQTKIEWADSTFNPWARFSEASGAGMIRVGKKRAGRLLDGIEHNGFPEVMQA